MPELKPDSTSPDFCHAFNSMTAVEVQQDQTHTRNWNLIAICSHSSGEKHHLEPPRKAPSEGRQIEVAFCYG